MIDNPWATLPASEPFIAPIDAPFVTDDYQRRHGLHCELTPVPYIGDPRKAAVVMLQLNPGYSELDREDELEIPSYADALRANLTFESTGFFFLDRRFKRTSAAYWWRPRLWELQQRVGAEALEHRLACVELFPYHSDTWLGPPRVPSQDFSFELVDGVIRRNVPVIVMRGWTTWQAAVPGLSAYGGVIRHSNPRSSYVSSGTLGADRFETVVRALTGC